MRIDQNIRDLAARPLGMHMGIHQAPGYWEFMSQGLEFILGDLEGNPFTLLVKDRDGKVMYTSANWPAEIDASRFPTPIEAGFIDEPEEWEPPWAGRHGNRPPDASPPDLGRIPPPDEQTPELFWFLSPGGVPPDGLLPDEMPPDEHGFDRGGPHWPDRQGRSRGGFRRMDPAQTNTSLPDGFPFRPPRDMGPLGGPPPQIPIRSQEFFTAQAGPTQWRFGVMCSPRETLVLGLNLAPYLAEMGRFRTLFVMAVPATLLLIGLGGWWLAQRALRPIQALTRTAEGITARGLDQRIPLGKEDVEFDRLIRVFNGMLDRLEKSFQQAVRFSADAAHELKTPLTILQGELAQAVQAAAHDTEQQQTLNSLLEEVQRLKTITRKLLLLSLADSGQLKPQAEPVNFTETVLGISEDIEILAPHLHVKETIEDSVWVEADPDLLRQIIQNLTSNAVKYNVTDGVVTIDLRRESDKARLMIGNSGPGIPPGHEEHVFERFFRADKAHNRRVDGLGLGLSLAREIARAHGGELVLEETRDGWTAFALTIPAVPRPANAQDPE